jgi:arylsulfatase A-like enzyme
VGAAQVKTEKRSLMPPQYVRSLPSGEVTLVEAFKEAGDKTFFAGKWHLGGKGS